MTKYIDLLRAHQQKKPPNTEQSSPDFPDLPEIIEVGIDAPQARPPQTASNPYSQPAHQDSSFEKSSIVEERIELPVDEPEPIVSAEALIADDEPVSSPEQKPSTSSDTNKTIEAPVAQDGAFVISLWLQQTSHHLLQIFQAAQQQQATDISPLNEMLRSLIDHIHATPNTLNALELEVSRQVQSIRDIDASAGDLVQKSIMMMLYTIKTGQQLQLQQQELIHITIAAMLHHIGMAMIPDTLRHKKERLTRSELEQIKQAPEAAHAYLKSCHIDDESILLAATQAAERYDGSGATGLTKHEIAWSARLVGLLSMFEALTHFRPYRPRFLPRDAIRELVIHHKKAFDPDMLKALIESISLYPVGTFVQINTGEIGQVIVVHNKFPLRPIILISMDKYGSKTAEREINLKSQPNLMIQKCMYEEALADLKQERTST